MSGAFANLDGLVRLSQRQGIDIRRPLLRVLTDLYVQDRQHSREQEQQFVELTMRLLPDVDSHTRISAARKLIAFRKAPASVLEALADAEPEVRAMLEAAQTTFADDAAAAPLPVETPTVAQATSLAPVSSEPEFAVVVSDAAATPTTLGEIFFQASSTERAAMLRADGAGDADENPRTTFLLPGRAGSADRIEAAALSRNQHDIVREFKQTLGLSNRTAWRIVQDESGEPLLVAANALKMSIDALVRTMLFINPSIGESVERVFSLAATYTHMKEGAGTAVLESWRAEAASRPPVKFHSVTAADGARDSRNGTAAGRDTHSADREQGPIRVNE